MKLEPAQQAKVAQWIQEGLKLADIQKRLASEFGLNPTYMEVRFLVDDLKLVPKDPEPPKPAAVLKGEPPASPAPAPLTPEAVPGKAGKGSVSVSVDQLTRPGAVVSGKVTFSDGKGAAWYLDQMGRFGVVPNEQGYKPSPADMQIFQQTLEGELAKLGF